MNFTGAQSGAQASGNSIPAVEAVNRDITSIKSSVLEQVEQEADVDHFPDGGLKAWLMLAGVRRCAELLVSLLITLVGSLHLCCVVRIQVSCRVFEPTPHSPVSDLAMLMHGV